MKKLFVLLILIVIASSSVSATFEEIHDDWHTSSDSWVIGTDAYSINLISGNEDKIVFKSNSFSSIINLGKCKTNNNFEYCYNNASYDVDEAVISPEGTLLPGINIIINQEKTDASEVLLTHSFVTNEIDSDVLSIDFTNSASEWINSISYTITIPEGINIISAPDFTIVGNKLKKTISLSPGKQELFDIAFEANNFKKYDFEYNLQYPSANVLEEKSGNVSVTIDAPYSLTASFSEDPVDITKSSLLTINLENKLESGSLNIVSMKIKGPSSLSYKPVKNLDFSRVGEYNSIINSVSSGSSKDFKLEITPIKSGDYNITINLVTETNGIESETILNKTLHASVDGITSQFYTNKEDVLSGSKIQLIYAIGNTNDFLNFKNVSVKINSDFFNDSFIIDDVFHSSSITSVYEKEITVPNIPDEKTFWINATTSYVSPGGEYIEFEKSTSVKVTGLGEILSISQVVTPTFVNPGDEIAVEVYVKNLKDELFDNVNAFESFSRGAETTFGESTKTISLQPLEEKKAYTYKLKLPNEFFNEFFNITSIAVIPNIGYTKQVTKSVSVNFTKVVKTEEEVVVNESEQIKVIQGDEKVEKKKPFLVRLVNSIENFFNNLFS